MLRFVVTEIGQPPLPDVHLDGPRIAIGSAADARIRLPATVARELHVEVHPDGWHAHAELTVDGALRDPGARGPIGDGVVFELGAYRVRVEPAPAGSEASPPQRTESLARELVRSLLGAGAAPSLHIERGPSAGATRALPPPEAVVVIGRGDEATWVILDEDLSRAHVEVRRGWDGVSLRDLGSKNGTRVDGEALSAGGGAIDLHDGAQIELGNLVLRFRDPAERHLRGPSAAEGPGASSSWTAAAAVPGSLPPGARSVSQPPGPPPDRSGRPPDRSERSSHSAAWSPSGTSEPRPPGPPIPWVAIIAIAVAAAALAGLIWVLLS